MLTIDICRSVDKCGSVVTAEVIHTLERPNIPADIAELMELIDGEFYVISNDGDDECSF